MEVSHSRPESDIDPSTQQIPLMEDPEEELNKPLRRLEGFLRVFGFSQSSVLSFALSWVSFFFLGFALPLFIIEKSYCTDCEKLEIVSFELDILVSQTLLAVISLLCVSHNLRKYGVRKFLFVDKSHGRMIQFHQEYINKIKGFYRLLAMWVFPCFLLKTAREVFRIRYIETDSWWKSGAIVAGLVLSSTYSNIIYLSGSALFNLVCNLQIIHFENYGKLLERDLDVSAYMEEHSRLTHHLSKISHRFRIFLLVEFLVVTASQFVALLQTTGNRSIVNFINGGDFAVSCIVEVVGIIICLYSAAKISHRAQALASVTSRWHALVTCNSRATSSIPVTYSESDLESAEFAHTSAETSSSVSSYHKRQAFVSYMQSNLGGATIFGWTVDRILINTIFFVEMSLVLFVLGKTITFSFAAQSPSTL